MLKPPASARSASASSGALMWTVTSNICNSSLSFFPRQCYPIEADVGKRLAGFRSFSTVLWKALSSDFVALNTSFFFFSISAPRARRRSTAASAFASATVACRAGACCLSPRHGSDVILHERVRAYPCVAAGMRVSLEGDAVSRQIVDDVLQGLERRSQSPALSSMRFHTNLPYPPFLHCPRPQ